MPKPRKKQPTDDTNLELIEITLTATVPARWPPRFISRDELAEWFNVDVKTTINWTDHGMPTEREGRRVKIPLPDAILWVREYRYRSELARHRPKTQRAPVRLDLLDALHSQLLEEADLLRIPRHQFVAVVPLEHDHPMRRAMLERAAAGVTPPPSGCTCGSSGCPVHGDPAPGAPDAV